MIILLIVVIFMVIVVSAGILKRKCPKCGSRGTSKELRRANLGPTFSQTGKNDRIQIDYKCSNCHNKWIDVMEEKQSI